MFGVRGNKAAGVGAAMVAVSALSAFGLAQAEADQGIEVSAEDAGPAVELAVDGVIKPGAELAIITPCLDGDLGAKFTSSFGVSGQLYPAADSPNLLGFLQLPADSVPASPEDPHHVTVTCDSGAQSTVRIDGANETGAGSRLLLQELR